MTALTALVFRVFWIALTARGARCAVLGGSPAHLWIGLARLLTAGPTAARRWRRCRSMR